MGLLDPHSIEFLRLFIAPIGILAALMVMREIFRLRKKRQKISSWVQCSAKVIELGYEETKLDGVTLMPVQYKYTFEGEEYIGTKCSIADDMESEGPASYFPDIYNELKDAKQRNRAIKIWVNPANPSQSLITNQQGKGTEVFLWVLVAISVYLIYFLFSRDSLLG